MTAYQEIATLGDFLRFGLPAAALKLARTTHAPLSSTGAGAGVVQPQGVLDLGALELDQLPVQLEVVAGGAVGTATWRWREAGSALWTDPTVTAQGARLLLPTGIDTGLRAHFAGTLVTGALYAWTSVSCVGACIRAGNEEVFRYVSRAFTFPLTEVPTDVVRDACLIIAADVAAVIGYSPEEGANKLIEQRAAGARKRFEAVRDSETAPRIAESPPAVRGPRVSTGRRR